MAHNVVVSMPLQLFTSARSFSAVAGGEIFIGKPDTDPTRPENQIPVYVSNEDGSSVQVAQPIIINHAGFPSLYGQVRKFLVDSAHSMVVRDALGVQQHYFPDVMKYDPDQFPTQLVGSNGWDMVGAGSHTLHEEMRSHGATTSSYGIGWATEAEADTTTDHSAAFKAMVAKERYVLIDTVVNVGDTITSQFERQRFEAVGVGQIRAVGDAMKAKLMLSLRHKHCWVNSVVFKNPLEQVETQKGKGRQGAIDISADYCIATNNVVFSCNQGIQTSAGISPIGTKVINNWILDHLGAGGGNNDPSNAGEDRGDAVVIWGSLSVVMGNYAQCREGQDARIAFHCEDPHLQVNPRPEYDGYSTIMTGNYARGPFRRHFVFENITNGLMANNISGGGATWWAEALIMCKNSIMENQILWDLKEGTNAGAYWSPNRAATCSGNYNHDCQFRSRVLFTADATGYGFVINTVTGKTDFSMAMEIVGNAEARYGLYLLRPDVITMKNKIRSVTTGALLVGQSGGVEWVPRFIDIGSSYQTSGSCLALNTGGDAHYIAQNCLYESEGNYALSLPNFSILILTGCGFKAKMAPIYATNPGKFHMMGCYNLTDKSIPVIINGSSKVEITEDKDWFFSGNSLKVYTVYALSVLQAATSKLNVLHRYPGMVVMVHTSGTQYAYYISKGLSPTDPWEQISVSNPLTPA